MIKYFLYTLFVLFSFQTLAKTPLIKNSSFKEGLTGWTSSGNVKSIEYESIDYAGFSGGGSFPNGVLEQEFLANKGEQITARFNVRRRGQSGGTVKLLVEFFDRETNKLIAERDLVTRNNNSHKVVPSSEFVFTAPSNKLLIRFTDKTTKGDAQNADFYLRYVDVSQENELILLPIELSYFKARIDQYGQAQLQWETLTEQNNDFFTIERSSNGIDWQTVKTVAGAGTTSTSTTYSTVDEQTLVGNSFYRLKQTDFDGKFEYSKVVSVKNNQQMSNLAVYPNPTVDRVIIEGDRKTVGIVEVYTINGQNVTNTVDRSITRTETVLDFSNLENGLYLVKTASSVEKIYKQ